MAQLTEEEQEEMETMAADNEVSRLDWPLARILPSDTRPLVVAGVWQYPAGNTSDHRGEGLGGKGADALSTRAQAERRATQQRGEEGGRHHEVAEDGGIVQVRTVAAVCSQARIMSSLVLWATRRLNARRAQSWVSRMPRAMGARRPQSRDCSIGGIGRDTLEY